MTYKESYDLEVKCLTEGCFLEFEGKGFQKSSFEKHHKLTERIQKMYPFHTKEQCLDKLSSYFFEKHPDYEKHFTGNHVMFGEFYNFLKGKISNLYNKIDSKTQKIFK